MDEHDEEVLAEMKRDGDAPPDYELPIDWSRDVPGCRHTGYYWWRPSLAREPEVVKVRMGVVTRCGSPHQYECVVLGGWWFGPLPAP